jgi:hypothetical protein
VSDSLRALGVTTVARAEERASDHRDALRVLARAREALDAAIERCHAIETALEETLADRGTTAAERALAQAKARLWRDRRSSARALRVAAERAHEAALAAVEGSREAMGVAHGERRAAESALARAEDDARAMRARRAEDDP